MVDFKQGAHCMLGDVGELCHFALSVTCALTKGYRTVNTTNSLILGAKNSEWPDV